MQKVRWGILGTARIATKVAKAIHAAEECELRMIGSRDLSRAKEWAETHGASTARGSYQDVLDSDDIDAVYIPLPPSMHAEWTIKAAEAKKHVLCEKPLGASTQEVRQMAEACGANGVQLMDGVMWYHHDRTEMMRQLIRSGELGELRRMTSCFTFRWAEIPKQDIRLQMNMAGGSLGDLGYYCVGATNWAIGQLPRRVFATARYFQGVDMNLSAMLWYDDDVMASFDCGFDTVRRKWFELAGTENSVVCDDFTSPKSNDQSRFWIHDGWDRNEERTCGECVQEVRMVEALATSVRTGVLDPQWGQRAMDCMRVCDALQRSTRKGAVVDVL